MIRFVVDGAEWRFDGWEPAEIAEALERLLDRIDVAREREEIVSYGDDLFESPVRGDQTVWDMLYDPAFEHDLRQRMSAAFMSMPRWADEGDLPEHWEVAIAGAAPAENIDVAFAHYRNLRRKAAAACLGLRRSGPYPVTCADQTTNVHWVTDEPTHVGFFRSAVDVEGDSKETLVRMAPHAFPTLHFVEGLWDGLDDFDGGYHRVRAELRRHLAIYADHGHWIFTTKGDALRPADTSRGDGLPTNQIIERRFVTHNIDIAPEKPNVAEDSRCRKARERKIGQRTLYCHWHGKIEPHINRIHLHPPVPESDDRVIIAIFHGHLPLP